MSVGIARRGGIRTVASMEEVCLVCWFIHPPFDRSNSLGMTSEYILSTVCHKRVPLHTVPLDRIPLLSIEEIHNTDLPPDPDIEEATSKSASINKQRPQNTAYRVAELLSNTAIIILRIKRCPRLCYYIFPSFCSPYSVHTR